jgi:hypothetical protein
VLSLNHYGLTLGNKKRNIQGVGGPQLSKITAEVLQWEDEEGNSGTFQHFIITGLQLCLWGRDIRQQLHMTLTTHKAQPWEESLSQAQQARTVMRPWEEAISQHLSCGCGLGCSCNQPPPRGH